MRRCAALLLALCLCAGGLIYAHGYISAQEEQLTIYPITETGDVSVLAGHTATVDINCGQHLVWTTGYTFGEGKTETDFTFIQNPPDTSVSSGYYSSFAVYLSRGLSASTTGGFSLLAAPGYAEMVNTVAALTPNGGSHTMNLKLKDFVEEYGLDYEVCYESDDIYCSESMSLYAMICGDYDWTSELWVYNRFAEHFRFPVQDDTIVSITVEKNSIGEITGIDFYSENAPQLELIGTVDQEGLWFVPVFRQDGVPLEAELPDGMGIYYVPWTGTGTTSFFRSSQTIQKEVITPDWENAVNIFPIGQDVCVIDLHMTQEEIRLLTVENGMYCLWVLNPVTGTVTARTELAAYDKSFGVSWDFTDQWMTVITGSELALVDLSDYSLELRVPIGSESQQLYYGWDSKYGILEYDGERLILSSALHSQEELFWICVYDHYGLLYYGKYDCSLLRCNDCWYYNSVYAWPVPIAWN